MNINRMSWIPVVTLIWGLLSAEEKFPFERLRLVAADSLIGTVRDGKTATRLVGGVQLIQGEAFLKCSEAIWHEKENTIILFSDVTVYDGKHTLRADQVEYNGETKTERASGHAVLESGTRKISARMLTYRQDDEEAFAAGSVRAEDMIEQAVLEGGRMHYNRKTDYALVEDGPILTKIDSSSGKTWRIEGKTMQAWGKEQRVLVSDSVDIRQDDLRGSCRKAEYFTHPNRIVLTGAPVVRQRRRKMLGDSLSVLLNGTRFAGAVLIGHGEMTESDSTGEDKLRGEKIVIEAEKDTLRHIAVENRAESVYRVKNEKGVKQGINAVSGDRIDLFFENEEISRIDVISRPGLSTGVYTPNPTQAAP